MAKSKKDRAGWVAISRSLQRNFIWDSEEPFDRRSAWIDLILTANHEPGVFQSRSGETVNVPAGATYTSIRKLAERWHWSKDKVRRYLATLTATQMITQTATPNGTLLTLVKYKDFQGVRDTKQDANRDTVEHTDKTRTTIYNNEQQINNNKKRPVSMQETMDALQRWAREESEDATD